MYTIWLADADWVSDGQGGYEMRPHQMVLASAYGDAVRVDEWDNEENAPMIGPCACVGNSAASLEERWKRRNDRGVNIDTAKLRAC